MEQYGVRFGDGSVACPWNGRTQRMRAEEYLARIRSMFPKDADRFQLVVRYEPGPKYENWHSVPLEDEPVE